MVDKTLPFRPLRWIFLDLNSYFASVEQAEDPALRGRPVAVAPVHGDGGTIVAASYEAKAFGVRTGHRVGEGKALCPELVIVPARPKLYVHYHNRVLEATDTVLPVDKVCSIDEMRFRLLGDERIEANAVDLAKNLKSAIQEGISPQLTSSIGIAPNPFLAKVATEFEKPNGLVVIASDKLPEALDGRKLTFFPGINKRMEARLIAHGIFRSDDMVRADKATLKRAFGSRIGEDWFHLLRGEELREKETIRKSLGHSHVLPPEYRSDERAREILVRLIHKAAARLRSEGLYTNHAVLSVSSRENPWSVNISLPCSNDAVLITERAMQEWRKYPTAHPMKVGITFSDLTNRAETTPSLFDEVNQREDHGLAVDRVNQKFGKNSVFIASTIHSKSHATEKIAFQKTELFSEGKGDGEWRPKSETD